MILFKVQGFFAKLRKNLAPEQFISLHQHARLGTFELFSRHYITVLEIIKMGLIQCAENCKYQSDGYCTLNKCTVVNSVSGVCPYLSRPVTDKNGGST